MAVVIGVGGGDSLCGLGLSFGSFAVVFFGVLFGVGLGISNYLVLVIRWGVEGIELEGFLSGVG